MPAQWAKANPDASPRDFELIARKVKLPSQDNYCDCGLFLLTYVEFFTYGLPATFHFNLSPKRAWDVEELMGASLLLQHSKKSSSDPLWPPITIRVLCLSLALLSEITIQYLFHETPYLLLCKEHILL